MARIVLPAGWSHRGQSEFDGGEGPLHEVIKRFADDHPHYRRRLLDPDGEPRTYFNVYLDDTAVPRGDRSSTTVGAGNVITIVPPMAGG
ncbi:MULTISPECIES: MoaD/ThiS family protein [Thermomonosporaceae]|uniref:MoaD/ThiS family protein n=1 Tax=Thermomonosporaceae TaxID=2012 RepID=UPI00255AEDD9|nr:MULTISPECIES: MoaD/ThiS family protein [Thermomonosporaceae]MDL4776697.1 MoaD/ThiS family protein [Actinomadura xylanilytica]